MHVSAIIAVAFLGTALGIPVQESPATDSKEKRGFTPEACTGLCAGPCAANALFCFTCTTICNGLTEDGGEVDPETIVDALNLGTSGVEV
ncbi:hypothetical protein SAPIO_CDS0343 [Scedosporium apiospermum]|uniref:Uncharacterized protein n=1 Tax=Pseudallescheria apiosperma TaxID=563466 RepID=A0A084GGT6_PSEDA|nr:uncharacterized protein SAPIO_CDS0343 [Scedosporium apiospermum]KEZ46548.1 hypothetical protein SAPIO_CDS0343 [Scedosporium apiospermum]